MDPVTIILLVAALAMAWWVFRTRGGAKKPNIVDAAQYLTPEPLRERFQIEGWDGFSGVQMALAVELSEGRAYPLIQAGTEPPASCTQTFSTATAGQTHLALALYAGLGEEVRRLKLAQRVSVGPIPATGEAIREVEVTFALDESGTVSVSAKRADDGSAVPCTVIESYLGAIPIGRR